MIALWTTTEVGAAKANGRYYWAVAENNNGHYDCLVATSESIYGPYGARYVAVPDGGHVTFFKNSKGDWWSTFFGADKSAPIVQKPAIVPMVFDKDGTLIVDKAR